MGGSEIELGLAFGGIFEDIVKMFSRVSFDREGVCRRVGRG